ncbi:MAG: four helix bundle protein [Acidobacteria bacterium]|nr:four helix bundle protein [Acidobacteriota bacterium]
MAVGPGGSAAEVQSHLHIALGIGYIDNTIFDDLYSKVTEISRMLLSLAQYLRENDTKVRTFSATS